MMSKTARIGSWIVLASLVLFLVLAIVFVAIGWGSADVATGQSMSIAGYVAMAFGIVATLALGIGLMSLVFYSNRKGHD
jgi:hypothetical protein